MSTQEELRILRAERDAAISERANAWSSLNKTVEISARLEAERDAAIAERDEARTQRDIGWKMALSAERDAAITERDAERRHYYAARTDHAIAVNIAQGLRAERDAAIAERGSWKQLAETLEADRNVFRKMAVRRRTDLDAAIAERDEDRTTFYKIRGKFVEEIAHLNAELTRLRVMLRRAEGYIPQCPACNRILDRGGPHAPDCALAKLIGERQS